MKRFFARLVQTNQIKPGYFIQTYLSPEIAETAYPGQFVHIRTSEMPYPLLRRPFSICRVKGKEFQILFKKKGEGTELLSCAQPGQSFDIIGPIGTGFRIYDKPSVLVAGGMGIAPLYFLAEHIKEKGEKILFFYGARSEQDLILSHEIALITSELKIATEDGSVGEKGLVTDLASPWLTPEYSIFACGPEPMLKALQTMLEQKGLNAQFSLENRMACGVGACMGCAVETDRGFERVCVDGPVFFSEKIKSFPLSHTGEGGSP